MKKETHITLQEISTEQPHLAHLCSVLISALQPNHTIDSQSQTKLLLALEKIRDHQQMKIRCREEKGIGCGSCVIAVLGVVLIRWLDMPEIQARTVCSQLCKNIAQSREGRITIKHLQNQMAALTLGSDRRHENWER